MTILNHIRTTNQTCQGYLKNKNIFLTGATGFLGKVLLSKIIRNEPNKIILLIRHKHGENSKERMDKMISNSLCFKQIKSEQKEKFESFIRNHIQIVEGDISKGDLGLSRNDLSDLTKNLDLVINLGASVSWKENISQMISTNLNSALSVMDIAQKSNAKHFIHISTIATIKPLTLIEHREHSEDKAFNFDDYIKKVEKMNENEIENETKLIKEKFGSTYAFAKAGSEKLIQEKRGNLSTTIIRSPSLGPSFLDPEAGWLDNITGYTGNYFYIGMGKSLAYLVNKQNKIYEMPVDIFSNYICHITKQYSDNKEVNIFTILPDSDLTVYDSMLHAVDYFKSNPVPSAKFIDPLFFDDVAEFNKYLNSLRRSKVYEEKLIEKTRYFNDLYMQANYLDSAGMEAYDDKMKIINNASEDDLNRFPLLNKGFSARKYVELSCEGLKKFYYKI